MQDSNTRRLETLCWVTAIHYENTPTQIHWKLLKTYCGYSLEPPRRGGSEYPQSMFFLAKMMYTLKTQVLLYKSGV